MDGAVRLTWEGRRPPTIPDPPPKLEHAGSIVQTAPHEWRNLLIHGDNLHTMAALVPEFAGKFALIYLDPPFFTGREFRSRERAPGKGAVAFAAVGESRDENGLFAISDESHRSNSPDVLVSDASAVTQNPKSKIQNPKSIVSNPTGFSDNWNSLSDYLQWLCDRLTLAYSLLADTGCLYLHLGWHSVHYAKLLLDEIFGAEQFQNEVVWCYREAINSKKRWNRKHDTILFYSKGPEFTFNHDLVREPYSKSTVKKFRSRDEKGPYRLMGRGIVDSPLRSKRDLPQEMETLFPELTYRHYLGDGTLPVDYWFIDIENQASKTRTGYPTQKPEALLERILLASSNEGDLIGDFCCGSGTTLAAAERLDRRWVGCDANSDAVEITRNRLEQMRASFHLCELAINT